MKRFLIVLFGVLVFQGSVWATTESCLKNWPPDPASFTKAKILHPAAQDLVIPKNRAFGLTWQESSDTAFWLGKKVKIRLYERGNDKRDLFKDIKRHNTGIAVIKKRHFTNAGVMAGKEYYFEIQHPTDKNTKITSECFTFNVKQKEDLQCDTATNMKDCVKVLMDLNRDLQERVSELENTVKALEVAGNDEATGREVSPQAMAEVVNGPTPWVPDEMGADDTPCYDVSYAKGAGRGNGWVVGRLSGGEAKYEAARVLALLTYQQREAVAEAAASGSVGSGGELGFVCVGD